MKDETLVFLRNVQCFAELDESSLLVVNDVIQPVEFEDGEIICTEGEIGDRMYIIESGDVAVLKHPQDGESIEVTVLSRGDIAGEMGLFGHKKRSATLQTRGRAKAWAIDYSSFEDLLERHGSIARGLLSYLCRHLVRETSMVARLMAKDMEKGLRIAFFHATPFRNDLYSERNKYNYAMHFFSPRLTMKTVPLATGSKVVVVSANDCVDKEVVDELAALGIEMIALRCAGYNNVNLAACERNAISVARVPAYSPYAVAEHAVALMMALNRNTHRAHNRVREGNFSLNGLVGFDMHGRTAGIIGTGKIGSCLLSILHGFGCRLLANDMFPRQELVDRLGVTYVERNELLAESDIISLHAPLTPETHHLINAEAVQTMKPGVMLINTSRGGLVDTKALLDGLKSGHIGSAGLDVYEEEQAYFFEDFSNRVITDDILARLMTFNNVMITSHQGSLTDIAQQNMVDTTIENIHEFELGKRGLELTNAVCVEA